MQFGPEALPPGNLWIHTDPRLNRIEQGQDTKTSIPPTGILAELADTVIRHYLSERAGLWNAQAAVGTEDYLTLVFTNPFKKSTTQEVPPLEGLMRIGKVPYHHGSMTNAHVWFADPDKINEVLTGTNRISTERVSIGHNEVLVANGGDAKIYYQTGVATVAMYLVTIETALEDLVRKTIGVTDEEKLEELRREEERLQDLIVPNPWKLFES